MSGYEMLGELGRLFSPGYVHIRARKVSRAHPASRSRSWSSAGAAPAAPTAAHRNGRTPHRSPALRERFTILLRNPGEAKGATFAADPVCAAWDLEAVPVATL